MNANNRIKSDVTTMFLKTMLQPDLVKYIETSERKKTYFIKVYEALARKGFALDVDDVEEGGTKVWQKWRNLKRELEKRNHADMICVTQNGRSHKKVIKYSHMNFYLIRQTVEHLEKHNLERATKASKPVSNDKKKGNKVLAVNDKANIDNVNDDKKIKHEKDELVEEHIVESSEDLDEVEHESTENTDDEFDEELMKEFECNMVVEEDDNPGSADENNPEEPHSVDSVEIGLEHEPEEIRNINLSLSANTKVNIEPNSSLNYEGLNESIVDGFKAQQEILQSIKEIMEDQKCLHERDLSERIKTNELLEKMLEALSKSSQKDTATKKK